MVHSFRLGSITRELYRYRSVRQGDPHPLLLFNLVVDLRLAWIPKGVGYSVNEVKISANVILCATIVAGLQNRFLPSCSR